MIPEEIFLVWWLHDFLCIHQRRSVRRMAKKSSAKNPTRNPFVFQHAPWKRKSVWSPFRSLQAFAITIFATLPLLLGLLFLVLAADAGIRHIWSLMKHTRNKIKYLTHGEFPWKLSSWKEREIRRGNSQLFTGVGFSAVFYITTGLL